MAKEQKRLTKRREAQARIDELFSQARHVNVIHYSCESFYDRPGNTSPRITSIAVRNLDSGQTHSFSIHQVAETRGIDLDAITTYYDKLEREMLDSFYDYVRQRPNHRWLHWNMRDVNYGFAAIEHRYRVLGGEPVVIHENDKHDLARILIARYGPAYAGHPRMLNLVKLNHITDRDALSGESEAAAFDGQEYAKLHLSTLRKVDVISNIAEREWNGTLKTNSTWREEYGTTLAGLVHAATDHPVFKVLGAIGVVATIVQLVLLMVR